MASIINIKDLDYKDILHNIDISINKNDFITISGSNKCGKTTLIKILNKEINTNNKIKVNNKDIKEYSLKEYKDVVGSVIYGTDNLYLFNTVEDETNYLLDKKLKNRYKELIKLFKLTKYEKTNPNNLDKYNKLKLNILKEVILKPKILLLDDIFLYLSDKETNEILKILKYLQEKDKLTIILTTSNLNNTIDSDYLYILSEGKIVLEGKPLEVLEKDNLLNRLGLELPFMIDLSVKLKDYNLVDNIKLDMDRMVEDLWK